MIRRDHLAVVALAGLTAALAATAQESKLRYPETKKVDHTDEYHGTKVPDPYRWLEDDVRKNKDVAEWVAEQNKVTEAYLGSIPQRDEIKKRITELWNYERYSPPFEEGGRYFFSKNDGLQNQSVLYVQPSLDAEPRVLLDPNKWSKDGTVALAGLEVSEDAKLMAYGMAEAGSDWNTWKVLDVGTGKPLDDELKWVKFSGASWTHDGKGFFYSRFPEPEKGAAFQGLNLNQKLYYHKLGTPQAEDRLTYTPGDPKWGVNGGVTDDGKYLIISVSDGTTSRKNRIAYQDLAEAEAKPVDLIDNFDNKFFLVGNDGPVFFFRTDWKAPKGQLVAIDTRKPEKKDWKTIIPESKDTLEGVNLVGDRFICEYLQDAKTAVKVYAMDGTHERDVKLPGIGTASGFGGERKDKETFYSFSSFATPPSIYRYDVATGESTRLRQAKVKFEPSEYEVKQVFVTSKDGTKVPMFITHKKGVKLDGNNPTLLYGYGGFNISLDAGVPCQPAGVDGDGRGVRGGEPARRRRVRRQVAPRRHQARQAERLRRLHRSSRVPDQGEVHEAREAGDPGRQQRRLAGRRGDDAAAGVVRGVSAGGRGDGHAAVPEVHRRPVLGGRLRLLGQQGGVRGAVQVQPVPQPQARDEVPGDAGDDGGHRRPGGAGAQLQVHRDVAVLPGRRRPGAGADRDEGRPRGRQADHEDDRGGGRPVGVPGEEPGVQAGAGEVTSFGARSVSEGRK